jgi:UDP-glucose 4-epimerase
LPKRETLAARPVSPYAASKLATESYALAYQHSFGLPVLAFRFFNVFGPLQGAGHAYAAVIPAFLDALISGRPLPVHGDGRQTRDFTFVDTVAAVIADAVTRPVTHDSPVNLAFGTRTDLMTVIDLLVEITGESVEVAHSDPRAGDVRDSQADDGLLRSLFPEVDPVGLADGLRKTYDWFRSSRVE